MNWDLAGIIGVVQSKVPWDKFYQSIEVHAEGGLQLVPHKDLCTLLELRAALSPL